MAYKRNVTEQEREKWKAQTEEQHEYLKGLVANLAESYRQDPEQIAEVLAFSSRFYQYSVRNTMLIYGQNEHATYVQSFQAWKRMGASVKKGEKGLKVYVPVQATLLKIEDKLVPLEYATKEQKARYHAGEIESVTKQRFKIGNVFDISQTDFPVELYPTLYSMGYPSELHQKLSEVLSVYAKEELNCPVEVGDLKSIALYGYYQLQDNKIMLNEKMEDTQRLSTLSHELGHAILHKDPQGKPLSQIEMEADALGIMLESYFGIQPVESRKRHLAQNYRNYEAAYREGKVKDSFGTVLENVNRAFREHIPVIEDLVEKMLPQELHQMVATSFQADQSLEEKKQKHAGQKRVRTEKRTERRLSKQEVHDAIKREIRIEDYAQSHGIVLRRVGRYLTLADHDSVRIDPEKNCFWQNSGRGTNPAGSVIDFAAQFIHNGDLHAALSELEQMVDRTVPITAEPGHSYQAAKETKAKEKPEVRLEDELPERASNMKRAYAYLIKSRYLDQDVVQDFVNQKMLYQDVRGNCVFVSYEGEEKKPVYATFRGTLTERKFLGDVIGSDYEKGFYIDHQSDKLIVTESVIDAMSVMSILKGQEQDYKAYDYLVLTGTGKTEALLYHLQEQPKKEVLLSMDRDIAGIRGMQRIEDLLQEQNIDTKVTFHVPEHQKDWNEELASIQKQWKPLSEISYLEREGLPEIRQCAIQSTKEIEESGFRRRGDKEQYRLVEVKDGILAPVELPEEKKNVLYFSPEEVKQTLPELYEIVPLETLEERIQQAQMQQVQTKQVLQEGLTKVTEAANPYKIEQVVVMSGMYVAEVTNGMEEEETLLSKEDGKIFYTVGNAFDGTEEKYLCTKEDLEKFEEALMEQEGRTLADLPEGRVVEEAVYEARMKRTGILEQVQSQELQKSMKQDPIIQREPELMIS